MIQNLRVQHPLRLAGRILLWLTVTLVLVRGTVGILVGGGVAAVAEDPVAAFPIAQAQAFAERFARDYLTYDQDDPQTRRALLSAYLPAGSPAQAGWDGAGSQTATAAHAVDADVESAETATVTVGVQLDHGRWRYIAVPVQTESGRFVVPVLPWFVAAPEPAVSTAQPAPQTDREASESAWPSLEVFFDAYARGASTDLAYLAAPGVAFSGLDGAVELAAVVDVEVERVDGGSGNSGSRSARATVRWRDPASGAQLEQTYELSLVHIDDRWLVRAIGQGEVAPGKET